MASRNRRSTIPRRKAGRSRRAQRRPIVSNHHHQRLAWYGGLALMAVLEVIEWPIAIVMAVGHEFAHRARTQALRELAEGIEAGA
jgi:hypothetical protein